MPTELGTTLILVPTHFELQRLGWKRPEDWPDKTLVRVIGFGPVITAALATFLLSQMRPDRVLLLGIAGAFTRAIELGSAMTFSSVALDGVGVWRGGQLQLPSSVGLSQDGRSSLPSLFESNPDVLPLASVPYPQCGEKLLTVCAPSRDSEEAAARIARHAGAVVEEMEGYSIAYACALHGIPCSIIRGISNYVGDPNWGEWKIDLALANAKSAALSVLEQWSREPK